MGNMENYKAYKRLRVIRKSYKKVGKFEGWLKLIREVM
jgi:hypothetical protein